MTFLLGSTRQHRSVFWLLNEENVGAKKTTFSTFSPLSNGFNNTNEFPTMFKSIPTNSNSPNDL